MTCTTGLPDERAPSVSVILPTHNRAALLGRTIAVVLAQKDVDLELIVVDDGSSDGTKRVLEQLDDPRVSSVRHERAVGLSAARNAGAAIARSDVLAFIDDDDVWSPLKLRAQLSALRREPDSGWSVVGAVTVNEAMRVIRWQAPPSSFDDLQTKLFEGNPVPGGGSGVAVRRELFIDIGGFDSGFGAAEDWDLWFRLAHESRAAIVPRPLVAWQQHSGNTSRNVSGLETELRMFSSKHALAFDARGVTFDWISAELSLAGFELSYGRWRQAAKRYARAFAHRPRPAVAARLLMLLPGGLELANRRQVTRMPQSWRDELNAWLVGNELLNYRR